MAANESRTDASAYGAASGSTVLTVGPVSGLTLSLCRKTLQISITAGSAEGKTEDSVRPVVVTQEEELDFARWKEISHETVKTEEESVPAIGHLTEKRIPMPSTRSAGLRRPERSRRKAVWGRCILNGFPSAKRGFP